MQSTEEVVAAAMEVLRRLFGDAIPQPSASLVTKWRSDEYARGGCPILFPALLRTLVNACIIAERDAIVLHADVEDGLCVQGHTPMWR